MVAPVRGVTLPQRGRAPGRGGLPRHAKKDEPRAGRHRSPGDTLPLSAGSGADHGGSQGPHPARHPSRRWKVARGVTMPKPGKDDYGLAKSYRVISLLNCLGKMVEKGAEMLVSAHCEATGRFHSGQYGRRVRRSAVEAAGVAISQTQEAWGLGRVTGALLMDVAAGVARGCLLRKMRAMCSGPTVDPGRLGVARANCSWPGIYSWPGCGGPIVDLQLAWLWMARHPQLARANCGS